MAKIDLKTTTGFSIIYENDELVFKNSGCKRKKIVTIEDIREQLLNKELDCPEIFYQKYFEVDTDSVLSSKKVKLHIYTMNSNLAGIEFVKTKVTRCKKYPRIIEILNGTAIVLIQQYKSPKENRVIKIVAKKGQKIIIPSNYDFVAVNPRQNTPLIFAEIMSIKAISRVVLDDNSGMAYYVIRKNAKQEVVRNPNYKIVNEVEKVDMEKVIKDYGITPKTTVIKQLIRKYEKFKWLFKENSVTY
ncbi:MAG: glucose-6-phosphate isomerase family protein [Candidatus Dojkabacteria bacterium]